MIPFPDVPLNQTMQVGVGNRNEVTSGDVIMGWIRWESVKATDCRVEDSEKSVVGGKLSLIFRPSEDVGPLGCQIQYG